MKTIMVLDSGDYENTKRTVTKVTVRALIERDGKLLMQRDGAGVFKIPGGGVEGDEDHTETLVREVLEETGREVIPETIKEIGVIREIRRDVFDRDVKFVRDSYFYTCDVNDSEHELSLTQSEKKAGFCALWSEPSQVISVNSAHGLKDCMKRDTEFLKWYMGEKKGGDNAD
ncbi:MAG: NUDIX domain-containing protein [Lachnospiraceae bacterium]|nr:NUDIX domain-containing protein [Lachnospiraceae bacterium]